TVEREHSEEAYGVGTEESATGDETVEENEENGEEEEEYYRHEGSVEVDQFVNKRDSSDDESNRWDPTKAMQKAEARRGLVYFGIFPSHGDPEHTLFYSD
ncbi:hypothetical protein J4E91_003787, partial [Alternaria rosae]